MSNDVENPLKMQGATARLRARWAQSGAWGWEQLGWEPKFGLPPASLLFGDLRQMPFLPKGLPASVTSPTVPWAAALPEAGVGTRSDHR